MSDAEAQSYWLTEHGPLVRSYAVARGTTCYYQVHRRDYPLAAQIASALGFGVGRFIGHAEAINIEFHNPVTEAQARAALKNAPGVVVIDHRENDGYVTPAECAGEDAVYVSRIRKDPTIANGLSLWCVSDNLRKGAALNTIQIAEVLIRDYLKK